MLKHAFWGIAMGIQKTVVCIAAATIAISASATAETLGPERVVDTLRNQMAESYDFVVSFQPDVQRNQVFSSHAAAVQNVVDLPLLNSFAATLQVEDAFRLADIEGVEWVWHLHPDEAELTRNAMRVLEDALSQDILVTNMPFGPPSHFYRKQLNLDAPVSHATRRLARQGNLAVVAIGDTGSVAPGLVNPWSIPPWVLSVGVWDHRSNGVWDQSSTGDPQMPHTWPDVVAPGVDVIAPMTATREKSDAERAYDEGNARFRRDVPQGAWDRYTLHSGSGMAAAQVSAAARQVAVFLSGITKERDPQEGDRLFSISIGPERITAHDRTVARLTGRATSTSDGGMEYTYWMDQPWKMIKQILIDTAVPAPDAPPWQVGAGIVDIDYIRTEFGRYGISNSQILASKVLE